MTYTFNKILICILGHTLTATLDEPKLITSFNVYHNTIFPIVDHRRSQKLSLYPQTKVGDILDSGPSRRRRRRRRRNFLVDAITQKQINIFFSNLVHMLRVPKGRSLF